MDSLYFEFIDKFYGLQLVCIRPSPVRRLIDNVATVRNPNICARQTGPHGGNVSVLLDKISLAKFEQNGFLSKKQRISFELVRRSI